MIPAILLIASLGVLILGSLAWVATSSKPVLANVVFVTIAFFVAASSTFYHGANAWAATIAFLATMVIAGRALGTWLRSRRQTELASTAHLLLGATAFSVAGTLVAAWPILAL